MEGISGQARDGERALGQDGNACARALGGEQAADGRADVMAGRQVSSAHHGVRQRTVKQDAGLALDQQLDLSLPLFRALKAGRRQAGEHLLGAASVAQDSLEAGVGRNTLATFTGQEECAARLENARAGAHSFDALVEVLVKRVAAVGGDDHLERSVAMLHRGRSDKCATGLMGGDQVPREDAGDLPLLVKRHVQQEARPDAQRNVAHLFPDRIALGDTKRGTGSKIFLVP